MNQLTRFAILAVFCHGRTSKCDALQLQKTFLQSKNKVSQSSKNSICCAMSNDDKVQDLMDRADRLRQQAQDIRSSLPPDLTSVTSLDVEPQCASEWTIKSTEKNIGYRLYLDIGRDPGTWMDPRWGASGKRIALSLDVVLCSDRVANTTTQAKMVKDNFTGKSTPVYQLESAQSARLRNGFDRMKCNGGGYRIDMANDGQTVRFFIEVEGKDGAEYGDISIPKGCLYFSLPCFGQGAKQLSSRDGLISVRQVGWHTGFRREESRIIGSFRASSIEKANKQDKY